MKYYVVWTHPWGGDASLPAEYAEKQLLWDSRDMAQFYAAIKPHPRSGDGRGFAGFRIEEMP